MLRVNKAKFEKLLALKAMNAAELAEATGLSVMTISKLSRGLTVPRAATMRKITQVLGCEPADLLEEVEE